MKRVTLPWRAITERVTNLTIMFLGLEIERRFINGERTRYYRLSGSLSRRQIEWNSFFNCSRFLFTLMRDLGRAANLISMWRDENPQRPEQSTREKREFYFGTVLTFFSIEFVLPHVPYEKRYTPSECKT